MKGFIEVNSHIDGKMLINIKHIVSVYNEVDKNSNEKLDTIIRLSTVTNDDDGNRVVDEVAILEEYEQVIKKLRDAVSA